MQGSGGALLAGQGPGDPLYKKRERPVVGRSRSRCWLQRLQIPSIFVGLDVHHQQFVDILLVLAEGSPLVQPWQVCVR